MATVLFFLDWYNYREKWWLFLLSKKYDNIQLASGTSISEKKGQELFYFNLTVAGLRCITVVLDILTNSHQIFRDPNFFFNLLIPRPSALLPQQRQPWRGIHWFTSGRKINFHKKHCHRSSSIELRCSELTFWPPQKFACLAQPRHQCKHF